MANEKNLQFLTILCFLLRLANSDIQIDTCGQNLKPDRYISRNNLNSSCDHGSKKAPRILDWSNERRECSLMTIDLDGILVFTVATNDNDGFERFVRSTKVNGFYDKVQVLGFGEAGEGGNVPKYTGGGYKLNLLKKALKSYKDSPTKRIVIFTDSYDVIFLSELSEIVKKFKESKARILFSAERSCWPNETLASEYPPVARGERFLNSGGFIGYDTNLYAILTNSKIKDEDDDQLFLTEIYLDPKLRKRHRIKLDHKSEIFQNLHGAGADVELRFKGKDAYLQNIAYNTAPLIVHGNRNSKLDLNHLGNFLPQAWSPEEGCISCWENTIELPKDETESHPVILIAIFIEKPMPFLEEFFEKIHNQTYPKSKLHFFIHNNVPYHEKFVGDFLNKHGNEYESLKQISPDDNISELAARNLAMDHCLMKKCSGYFSIDAEAHLDNEHTLRLLVEQQRGIVAPLLSVPFKTSSNFWGAINENGSYALSSDYLKIVNKEMRGLWNVPLVSTCYLINSTIISNEETRPSYSENDLDPTLSFALSNRKKLIFMYVSNRLNFGHLIVSDSFNTSLTNPDLYQIMDNRFDWEKRYLHEDYSKNFEEGRKHLQPCTDVFWFPIVSPRMTKELIEVVEAFGHFSDGSVSYPRLGEVIIDPVPTQDVFMSQVGLLDDWLYFIKEYVTPLQMIVLPEVYEDPPRASKSFVVRYRPDEQASLKPHFDTSTYTINIALNRAGIDYKGGGCRFIRYNCSVKDTRVGWMLMHPGRALTHMHEGLATTKGTRYVLVSFINPPIF